MSGCRIVCCYIDGMLRPETEDALVGQAGPMVDLVRLSDSPHSYGQTLAAYWRRGAEGEYDLAIVEQDVVIRPDVIDAFLNCPCEYGAFPYSWGPEVGPALGCTRFRVPFMQRYPDAMRLANLRATWRQLDVVFQRHILVREHGEQPHICGPQVEHLNQAKQPRRDVRFVETLPAW